MRQAAMYKPAKRQTSQSARTAVASTVFSAGFWMCLTALCVFGLLAAMPATAQTTFTVTTLVDDASSNAANCNDTSEGAAPLDNCSLRDAIAAANALPQTTVTPVTKALVPTINFASSLNLSAQSPGTYTINLDFSYDDVCQLSGEGINLAANMNIVGPGANLLTINGAGNEIFYICSGTVFLSGLTLTNGVAPSYS